MQTRNRIFDDLARAAGGAFSSAASLREEIEAQIRPQLDRILARLDLVTREEFEAAKEMAAKARAEQERLSERLVEIEEELAKLRSGTSKRARKPTVRKSPQRKSAAKPAGD